MSYSALLRQFLYTKMSQATSSGGIPERTKWVNRQRVYVWNLCGGVFMWEWHTLPKTEQIKLPSEHNCYPMDETDHKLTSGKVWMKTFLTPTTPVTRVSPQEGRPGMWLYLQKWKRNTGVLFSHGNWPAPESPSCTPTPGNQSLGRGLWMNLWFKNFPVTFMCTHVNYLWPRV